jgi:capsule polysaccharide modification protein KpsS
MPGNTPHERAGPYRNTTFGTDDILYYLEIIINKYTKYKNHRKFLDDNEIKGVIERILSKTKDMRVNICLTIGYLLTLGHC